MSFGTHASFVSNSVLGNSTFGTTGHHPSRSRVTLTFGTQRPSIHNALEYLHPPLFAMFSENPPREFCIEPSSIRPDSCALLAPTGGVVFYTG